MTKPRSVFSVLMILLGYILFAVFGWGLRSGFDVPVELYWLSFVFVAIPLLLDIAFWHEHGRCRILFLLALSLMVSLQYVIVDTSPYITSSDGIFDFKLTEDIMKVGWNPGMGHIYDRNFINSFYPVTNLLYIIVSTTSGISLVQIVKYLFLVSGVVLPLFILKWLSIYFDRDIAYLATAVFVCAPDTILYPHHQVFAFVFLALAFYFIAKSGLVGSRQYAALGLISITTMILTHHFTTYIFVGLLVSLFVVQHLFKKHIVMESSFPFLLLCIVLFGTWTVFVSLQAAISHADMLLQFLSSSPSSINLAGSGLLSSSTSLETYLTISGLIVTGVYALGGFVYLVKHRNHRSYDFLIMALFFSPLLGLSFLYRFSGFLHNIDISQRIWEFAYICVGCLVAYVCVLLMHRREKTKLKALIVASLLLVFIVGPMLDPTNPRIYGTKLAKFISYDGISASNWLNVFSDNENVIVEGSQGISYMIFGGYGGRAVTFSPEFFSDPGQNLALLNFSSEDKFAVTNVYLPVLARMRGENSSEVSLEKFDSTKHLDRVYDNSIFKIYRLTS